MLLSSPTIVALETDSAWVVILAVSLVTLPCVLLLRKLINRPGGITSAVLLILPLALPLVLAAVFQQGVLPEISVLRPVTSALGTHEPLRFLWVSDGREGFAVPYALIGSTGPWLFLIGVSASSFMLLRRFLGWVSMRSLLRRCSEVDSVRDAELHDLVEVLSSEAGLKVPPALYFLPREVSGAFAMGGGRARILISRDLVEELECDELQGILAHELAHISAHDIQTVVIAGLLRDLVAWNPFAHIAYRRLTTDREFEADRRAASLTGKPLALASSIVKVCELMRRRPVVAPRSGIAFARPRGRVSRRVTNLLALADGRISAAPASTIPYIAAACLAALLGLQVAARLSQADSNAFAIVWGNSSNDVKVFETPRKFMGGTAPAAERRFGKGAKAKQGELERLGHFPGDRYPNFEASYLVQAKDLHGFMRAFTAYARSQGYKVEAESLSASPVLSGPGLGVFKIEASEAFASR
ncbi:MAG: heat shock protein HtpX [Actinomycetota bacterium]|nr:heat shock protein HtpX [Actinomycetota bacterium]